MGQRIKSPLRSNKKDQGIWQFDGKSIHYHINGEIGRIENYKDGYQNGNDIFYDKDGKIFWSGNYKDGIFIYGDFLKSDRPFNLH